MNRRAFTLIEVVLVAAIIAIIAGLAAVRLGIGGRTEAQRNTVDEFTSLLSLAPSLARSYQKELRVVYNNNRIYLELPDGTPVQSVPGVLVSPSLQTSFSPGVLFIALPTGWLNPAPGLSLPIWFHVGNLYYLIDVAASGSTRITYSANPP